MKEYIKQVLFDEAKIKERVKELGRLITEDYRGKDLVLVTILRGACVFLADLMREIEIPCKVDFMAISSYGNTTKSSGEVRVLKDLNTPIENKHILIVEDIIDSGYTLNYLKGLLGARQPASVKICALLDKPERREVNCYGDYVGFEIPNAFIVGYGLDYAEYFRNLPYIGILDFEKYQKENG
ncbi:MAG: hypoxanthine phosphoribosyltransferase [Christensenellales bacterium]